MNAFRSAVVPAAGLGTRFLPTTKTVPKELLPVVDTPGIELVAAEAAAAGAEELLIVTSPGKDAVAAHFADSSELEKTLAARGKEKLVAKVRRAHELINVRTVTQDEPLGLGHAVGCAREAIGPDEQAFAVLLPDDLVLPAGVLSRMAEVRNRYGGSVLCAFDIPREEISAYGVFDVSDTDDADVKQVHGMVEKPAADEAPSTFAAAGRYLLDVAIFDALRPDHPGRGRRAAAHRRRPAADLRGPPRARRGAPRRPPRPRQPRQLRPRVRRLRPRKPRVRAGAARLARRAAGALSAVRSVDEQLERVLGAAVRPAPVRVAITEAYGLRCAEEVVSARPLPGFDMAAIDGYAVRSVDVFGAGEVVPVELPVVGEIPAGSRHPLRLQPGQAVRVAAGAPLPTLADAVVPVGYTDAGSARVSVTRSVPSAAFVRRLGEDVQPGDIAVRRDAVLGAAQVGLLAAAGRDKVLVHPRPRVSVISVGDELVDLARTPGRGPGRRRLLARAHRRRPRGGGGHLARGPRPRRRPRRSPRPCRTACRSATCSSSAGRSAGGRAPRCRPRSTALGDLDTTRVAMHPGSTQGFGRLGPDGVPTFLFPSQPATALLLFEVLVRPLLRTIAGPSRRPTPQRLGPPDLARHLGEGPDGATCAAGCCARRPPATTSSSRSPPPASTCCRRWPTRTA